MWARDLRVAIRFGFSATAFSGTVVAVLGIAMAGATATFSVAYHVLLARKSHISRQVRHMAFDFARQSGTRQRYDPPSRVG